MSMSHFVITTLPQTIAESELELNQWARTVLMHSKGKPRKDAMADLRTLAAARSLAADPKKENQ